VHTSAGFGQLESRVGSAARKGGSPERVDRDACLLKSREQAERLTAGELIVGGQLGRSPTRFNNIAAVHLGIMLYGPGAK
jgi:hypothetical protein